MHDEVVGDLTFQDYWERIESIRLFNRSYEVALTFEGEPDEPLNPSQQMAFAAFDQDRAACLSRVEAALLQYYLTVLPDVRRQLGDTADALAPVVAAVQQLAAILTPTHISFPVPLAGGTRVVGLLFDCTWDPELGIGVRLVDEAVRQVGTQDIVL